MSQPLSTLVDALFDFPTLVRLDELLAALGECPRDQPVSGLIDDLLDYRVVLAETLAAGSLEHKYAQDPEAPCALAV
jgi:hypothetical protein